MVVALRHNKQTAEMAMRSQKRKQQQAAAAADAQSASQSASSASTPNAPGWAASNASSSSSSSNNNNNKKANNTKKKMKKMKRDPRDAGTPPREGHTTHHNNNDSSTGGIVVAQSAAMPTPSFGIEDYKVLAGCIENMDSIDTGEGAGAVGGEGGLEEGRKKQSSSERTTRKGKKRGSNNKMSAKKVEAASRAAAAVLAGGSTVATPRRQQDDDDDDNDNVTALLDYSSTSAAATSAAAVAATGEGTTTTATTATTTSSREFQRQQTEVHSNITTNNINHHHPTTPKANTNGLGGVGILGNGSNEESIVVSSPSGGASRGSRSSLSMSNSPASFMLDDSILDPRGASSDLNFHRNDSLLTLRGAPSFAITPNTAAALNNLHHNNNHQHQHPLSSSCYNPSPTSLEWDSNMDNFFDDLTTTGGSTGYTPGGMLMGGGGGGSSGDFGSSRGLYTPPERTNKRKNDDNASLSSLYDSKQQLLHQGGDDENKRSKISLLPSFAVPSFAADHSFGQFATAPSMNFGSLSNSSTEEQQQQQRSPAGSSSSSSSNKQVLTPRTGPSQKKATLPPQAPHLSDDEAMDIHQRSYHHQERLREQTSRYLHISNNERSHPSKGTLEQYDNELYTKLKNSKLTTTLTQDMRVPQLLVPHDDDNDNNNASSSSSNINGSGNRLVIIQGSSKSMTRYKLNDIHSMNKHSHNHNHNNNHNQSSSSSIYSIRQTYEFYKFLRQIYPALEGCTYLLPGLVIKQQQRQRRRSSGGGGRGRYTLSTTMSSEDDDDEIVGPTINVSSVGNVRLGHVPGMTAAEKSMLNKSDLKIAKRRVECAIYAFGGSVTPLSRKKPAVTKPNKSDKMSIFRNPPSSSSTTSTAATSSSSAKSTSSRGGKSKKRGKTASSSVAQGASNNNNNNNNAVSAIRREKYEKRLRQQYFEHGNRLSWDVQCNLSLTLNGAKTFDDDELLKRSGSNVSNDKSARKNRCKKCGQIKLGHVCPYVSSLARNIGIMVYPSANAHVADEPGVISSALCEMNNFISIKSGSFGETMSMVTSSPGGSSEKKTRGSTMGDGSSLEKVVSEGSAARNDYDVVAKVDKELASPFRRKTLFGLPSSKPEEDLEEYKRSDDEDERVVDEVKKSDDGGGGETKDLLFQPKMEITLDQYRTVTPFKDAGASGISKKRGYTYPHVPLTFTQRKSMSDALFSLSKQVPKLTDECALVLTEARKRDQWDLAVAELMVQVICVLHCSPSMDYKLEGLRRYLLTLGIVC